MTIYEYVLEDAGAGLTCPHWINDGGYFVDGSTMIGIRDNGNTTPVPAGAVSFTSAELETRCLALHAVRPFTKENPDVMGGWVNMTNAETSTMVQEWVTLRIETER
jgi:hypothetical protein